MSQRSFSGAGSLVCSVPTTFIKENHSTRPAFLMARAQEHALTVLIDGMQLSMGNMLSRNTGWQTVLSPVNQNRHSWVGSHRLATQTEGFLYVAYCCNQG